MLLGLILFKMILPTLAASNQEGEPDKCSVCEDDWKY